MWASELFNGGSCVLHIIHGMFQLSIKSRGCEWLGVRKKLKAMTKLFIDSHDRTDIFNQVSCFKIFLPTLFQTRRVENITAAS